MSQSPLLRLPLLPFLSLAAALALGLAGSSAEPAAGAGAQPGSLAISPLSHAEVRAAGDLARFDYVTLTPWYDHLLPQLRERNPQLKALVYMDMSSTRSYACQGGRDDALLPSGVGYCLADAQHPDWFLYDEAGRRCEWAGYSGHWQMDVGHPGYQQAWLESVLAELRRGGWDGVAIDNVMVTIADPYCPGRRFPAYPSAADYAAATRSFLAHVGPRLQAEGFLVLPNIQAHAELAKADLWRDWLQFTSGGTREYWMRWGTPGSHFGGQGWLELQEIFAEVQRQGKLFLTGTPTDGPEDVRSMRFGRASFLLGWEGGPAGFGAGNWHPEWTVEIGQPSGPRYRVGSAWRRDFSAGTALANASAASVTVPLGRSYRHPDGALVSSVTLPPMSGLVLAAPDRTASAAPGAPGAATPDPGDGSQPDRYRRAETLPKIGTSRR